MLYSHIGEQGSAQQEVQRCQPLGYAGFSSIMRGFGQDMSHFWIATSHAEYKTHQLRIALADKWPKRPYYEYHSSHDEDEHPAKDPFYVLDASNPGWNCEWASHLCTYWRTSAKHGDRLPSLTVSGQSAIQRGFVAKLAHFDNF